METVLIRNMTKNNLIIKEAQVADSFFTRFRGLLGRKDLKDDTGLIIKPCNSIHMIGMKFSIDAIFIDKDNKVCHIIPSMKAMSISPLIKKAKYVIEVPEGTSKIKRIDINDRIEMIKLCL